MLLHRERDSLGFRDRDTSGHLRDPYLRREHLSYRSTLADPSMLDMGPRRPSLSALDDDFLFGRDRLGLNSDFLATRHGLEPRETEFRDPYRTSRDYFPGDSATLYIQGIPENCTRRELSHIFRPLIGFKQLRLVKKNDRTMCFVEFTNKRDAAAAMDALEGYKMDETDENSPSLQIQFSRAPPKKESSFTSRSYKPERSRLPWL
eukprot:TRINITY_DN21286_c0_g2_i2.p1 TRINITY_DN21286_c0_g2~~TRINITY_DN21286_c0_g2_i2.p1  ORF type:complete len:205 (-),score=45.83 TRINITY_DN21286_c0_g2_i2:151-765(-)